MDSRAVMVHELRMLVAALDAQETVARRSSDLLESALELAAVALIALSGVVTLAPFALWGSAAAYTWAALQVAGALLLRARHLERPWWRRWLYGIGLGLMLATLR